MLRIATGKIVSPEVTSAKILFPRSIPARFLLTCYVRLPFVLASLLVPFDNTALLSIVVCQNTSPLGLQIFLHFPFILFIIALTMS